MATSSPSIAVVPGGGENVNSVLFALERLGARPELTLDAAAIGAAGRVILMGVGAAPPAMAKLRQHGLVERFRDLKQPVLGVCVGMQLLFDRSAEGDVECLGVLRGSVRRFPDQAGIVIPHKGWNALRALHAGNPLVRGVREGDCVYYMNSYYAPVGDLTIGVSDHGVPISAMVNERNFYGCQFHPERSGDVGELVLKNFLGIA
jgi:imidazole glycerol-phosphate synthase subunit HisH